MTMVAVFAQYFSDNLSGHTKKGLRERVRQGLFNGEPPFGYQRCDPECLELDESHTGCHPDPETAQIVRNSSNGTPMAAIPRLLWLGG